MAYNLASDRIERLRAMADTTETEQEFIEVVKDITKRGFPIADVIEALRDTEWRYVLENSGRSISVERRGTLISWYGKLLEQARIHIEELQPLEDGMSPQSVLKTLEGRESAGWACRQVALECRRMARYLFPDDKLPDAARDIVQFLDPLGLHWDGEYEIEAWPGENEALHERAASLLSARWVPV